MNQRSFIRKVIYLAVIVVLLVPLSLLSQPATTATGRGEGSAGGQLARLRDRYGLSQANLGKIDPASETIKLATLGMRGVAAAILWNQAHEYQKTEDWTKFGATLDQIANLQPNYVGVWRYQAWNLAYNVSAEFDNYRDRYYWVIEGLKYLHEGVDYNQHSPEMLGDVAWFAVQRIGRSDEREQFRRLFREDDDFFATQSVPQRDSWLYAKAYYRRAEQLIENRGAALRTMDPAVFYSQAPMTQINFAATLENEGEFGRRAAAAWQEALREWEELGRRELPSPSGGVIRLSEFDENQRKLAALLAEMERLAPGARDDLRAEKLAALPAQQRRALNTPRDARSQQEQQLANRAEAGAVVTDREVAERAAPHQRAEARRLAEQIVRLRLDINQASANLEHLNYAEWLARCHMELTDEALEARQLLYEATVALEENGDFWTSRDKYEQGFALWKKLLDEYPLLAEGEPSYQAYEWIQMYELALDQLDEPFPDDFVLEDLRQKHKAMRQQLSQ